MYALHQENQNSLGSDSRRLQDSNFVGLRMLNRVKPLLYSKKVILKRVGAH